MKRNAQTVSGIICADACRDGTFQLTENIFVVSANYVNEIEYIFVCIWCRRPSESDTIWFVILDHYYVRRYNQKFVNGYKLYLIPFMGYLWMDSLAAHLNRIEFAAATRLIAIVVALLCRWYDGRMTKCK